MIAADGWHIILTSTVHDELITWRNFIASLEERTMNFQDIRPIILTCKEEMICFYREWGDSARTKSDNGLSGNFPQAIPTPEGY